MRDISKEEERMQAFEERVGQFLTSFDGMSDVKVVVSFNVYGKVGTAISQRTSTVEAVGLLTLAQSNIVTGIENALMERVLSESLKAMKEHLAKDDDDV